MNWRIGHNWRSFATLLTIRLIFELLSPQRFAYIEFAEKDSVQTAMALDDSLFKGRIIKVNPKRTNRPGISTTNRGRGRAPRRGAYMGRGELVRDGSDCFKVVKGMHLE